LAKLTSLFFFFLLQISQAVAQTPSDSIHVADTGSQKPVIMDTLLPAPVIKIPLKHVKDSLSRRPKTDTLLVIKTDLVRYSEKKPFDLSGLPFDWPGLLKSAPDFNFMGKAVHVRAEIYEPETFEGLFYLLLIMLFYFAIIRLFYRKYMGNLLTLFFRTSMRKPQLREQVLQAPFPSLLLNILFLFSGGLYAAFVIRYYNIGNAGYFWRHFMYCAAGLAVLYMVKFLILKLVGWIFNIDRAMSNHLFVVFMTNKIIGICLLPFLVMISFSGSLITEICITLTMIMICVFYVYRILASYSNLHKEIKIRGLHFFLYLCAFEIAPLLLIYKVLVTYLKNHY